MTPGYFGKLPGFDDFIRYNSSSAEVAEFDQWLQEGLYFAKDHFKQEWGTAYRVSPKYHFLFPSEKSNRMLLGVFRPSFDQTEREYPFIVSLNVDREVLQNSEQIWIPLLYAQFFEEAQEIVDHAFNSKEMNGVVERLESIDLDTNRQDLCSHRFQEYLETTTLEDWFTQLFGNFDDIRKYLLYKNLTDIILPLRGQDLGRISLGLRFPLSAEMTALYNDVSLWIQMTRHLLRNETFVPTLFWTFPGENEQNFLFLFFRQPRSSVFVPLIQNPSQHDHICQLEMDGLAGLTDNAKNAVQNRSLLENGNLFLKDFLNQL